MTISPELLKVLKECGNLKPEEYIPIERIPTGSLVFDYQLGGGIPRGRITEIYGRPTWGKTNLALLVAASVTHSGGEVVWFDLEGVFDYAWAKRLGVDISKVAVLSDISGESVMEAISNEEKGLITHNACDLVVIDSITAMLFTEEASGDIGAAHMGLAARRWSQFCRKVSGRLKNSTLALLLVSQVRADINAYGTLKPTGGNAIPFYSAIQVRVDKAEFGEATIDGRKFDTFNINPFTIKNKTSHPQRKGEVVLVTSVERPFVHVLAEVTSLGKEFGIFTKEDGSLIKGAAKWHYEGRPIATGAAKVQQALRDNQELFDQVIQTIREEIEYRNTFGFVMEENSR